MSSSSESTKLEHEGAFIEYPGSNKLKDKKVLVTGGEYASPYYTEICLTNWLTESQFRDWKVNCHSDG